MKGLGGVVLMFMLLNLTISCYGQLRPGFYLGKCKRGNEFFNVEAIIRGVVEAEFRESRDGPKMAAALLRLQFHDCFVTGCDASLLLDGPDSEKKADANGSVRGYDVIDKVKAALEIACPGVVSCSDIIAVATRDAVKLSKGLSYRVETGRRDTVFVSKKGDVNLPSPSITVKDSVKLFESKGINKADMVLLLAAHTVGITHCAQVHGRLYNFRNKGKRDPTMGDDLFNSWSKTCPRNGGPNKEIALDQTPNSINVVDTGYLKQIKVQRGVLEIDQGLGLAPETAEIVRSYADGPLSKFFLSHFGEAMIKLGRVGVLTGKNGEIRRFCNAVNNPKPVQPTPVQPKPDGPTPKPAGGLTSLGL